MNWKKKISILLLTVFLPLILTAGLLITPAGLHLLIKIADWWVPGLTISTISGNWLDLRLQGIYYQISDAENIAAATINVEQLHFSLQPSCLKNRQLCIDNIQLHNVSMVVDTRTGPAKEMDTISPIKKWHTPWSAVLKQLTVRNLKIRVNNTAISLNELDTGAKWQGHTLIIMPTMINSLLINVMDKKASLPEIVTVAPYSSEPPTFAEKINVFFNKPLLPALPDIQLPLDIQIKAISGQQLRFTGNSNILVNSLLLQASIQDKKIRLDSLTVKSSQGVLWAQGEATMADKWPVNMIIKGSFNVASLKKQEIALNISGKLEDKTRLALNLSGLIDAQLNAVVSLAETGLPLLLTLQSKQLHWPLFDSTLYHVSDFKMNLQGKAIDYNLSVRSNLIGMNLPPIAIALDGQGNTREFTLTLLRLAALQGHTDISGSVNWHNRISWNAILTFAGVNTNKHWPQWPGNLDGRMVTHGIRKGNNWQIAITELLLQGHVRQHPFSVKGALTGNTAGKWQIPQFNLVIGPNRLNVQGSIDDTWSLSSSLDAPGLDGIFPGLKGVAKGTLKVSGKLQTPQLSVQIMANRLQWQKLFINNISLAGHIQSEKQIHGHLSLEIKQLKQDKFKIDWINLATHGNEHQHKLTIGLEGNPLAGQLTLEGHFNRKQQRYHGTLSNTHFSTPAGKWQPNHAIGIDYLNTAKKIIIQPHCWQNTKAQLCIPKPIETGHGGQARIVLSHFDMALLQPLIPATTMNGTLAGQADINWQKGSGLPHAHVFLTGNKIKIIKKTQHSPLQLALDTFNLNSTLNNEKIQLNWLVKLANTGQFSGHIILDELQKKRNISGNITVSNFSLETFHPLLMYDEKINGILNAELQLGGNTQKPLIFGRMKLDKFDINENWMPASIIQSRMAMEFNGMKSNLYGSIRTPDGQLTLSGDASWHNINKWHARITAKGKQLKINIPPMIHMDISPDLVVEATDKTLSLHGSVKIPKAHFKIHDLSQNVVTVSSDEIILSNNLQSVSKTSVMSVNSNLVIQLGNDVQLDALGLRARLQGNVKVLQDVHGLGLNGQIDISSGRFRAWGQDLIVRKGLLLFSGMPDRPFLDIEAIRNPDTTADNVIAGVRITGMADTPKTELFSDPILSQQETLSYLLYGRKLDNETNENSMMLSMLMLTGRGIVDRSNLAGKLGEAFAAKGFQLETEGTGVHSRVAVRGNVGKDLQIKYSRGIFDSLAGLTLRYRLMPNLYLEGVSGINQGIDILYQFEMRGQNDSDK